MKKLKAEKFDANSIHLESGKGFIWVQDFTDSSLKDFYSQFTLMQADKRLPFIPILISSYGGDVFTMLSMRDLIKACDKPVLTACLGKAMSAGAFLLAAGTKGYRFAAPGSTIMIHEASSWTIGKASDIKSEADQIHSLNHTLFENFAEDTESDFSKIQQAMKDRKNADWYLNAEQAKKLGVVDRVALPKFVDPGVQYIL